MSNSGVYITTYGLIRKSFISKPSSSSFLNTVGMRPWPVQVMVSPFTSMLYFAGRGSRFFFGALTASISSALNPSSAICLRIASICAFRSAFISKSAAICASRSSISLLSLSWNNLSSSTGRSVTAALNLRP